MTNEVGVVQSVTDAFCAKFAESGTYAARATEWMTEKGLDCLVNVTLSIITFFIGWIII